MKREIKYMYSKVSNICHRIREIEGDHNLNAIEGIRILNVARACIYIRRAQMFARFKPRFARRGNRPKTRARKFESQGG